MTSKDIQQKSVGKILAWVISAVVHGSFLVALILFGVLSPEKPEPSCIKVSMAEIPVPAQPPLPQGEPIPEPVPEPPAPEPEPVPEPPKPEPEPVPEPPAPEPEPVPEPPKPVKKEERKPAVVPVKKVEKVVPVKKKPAPDLKKPAPKPKQKSFEERFRERVAKSKVVTAKDRPSRKTSSRKHSMSKSEIRRRLNQGVQNKVVAVSVTGTSGGKASQSKVNYALEVVNPFLEPLWKEIGPGRGELGTSEVKPVVITMVIMANGRVMTPEILKKSDSTAMNRAAARILERLGRQRFSPLKNAGISESRIRVDVNLAAELGG